ncbi:MAG: preprotein translocase subunit YajC [Clostridia bacterium]|nr:preprotein translocase subunit YajC [Clostridia bacterium]
MTSMMLLDGSQWWNYALIGVVALLLIAMPIFMNQRNKRETQKVQEQTNSLKVGDKVLTTSGVYGTIVELKFDDSKKIVVIETGGKTKSYLSVDAYAIYTVFKDEDLKSTSQVGAAPEKKSSKKEKTLQEQVAEVSNTESVAVTTETAEESVPSKKKKSNKK